MLLIQVNSICPEDLIRPIAREYIEKLDTDFYSHFVFVTDGDCSLVYDFEIGTLIAPSQLTEYEYSEYEIGVSSEQETLIKCLDSIRERSASAYSGLICFRPFEGGGDSRPKIKAVYKDEYDCIWGTFDFNPDIPASQQDIEWVELFYCSDDETKEDMIGKGYVQVSYLGEDKEAESLLPELYLAL